MDMRLCLVRCFLAVVVAMSGGRCPGSFFAISVVVVVIVVVFLLLLALLIFRDHRKGDRKGAGTGHVGAGQ